MTINIVFPRRTLPSGLTVTVYRLGDEDYEAQIITPAGKVYSKSGYSTLASAKSRLYVISARCSVHPHQIEEIARTLIRKKQGRPAGEPHVRLRIPRRLFDKFGSIEKIIAFLEEEDKNGS